jgi:hypothetical protein
VEIGEMLIGWGLYLAGSLGYLCIACLCITVLEVNKLKN